MHLRGACPNTPVILEGDTPHDKSTASHPLELDSTHLAQDSSSPKERTTDKHMALRWMAQNA